MLIDDPDGQTPGGGKGTGSSYVRRHKTKLGAILAIVLVGLAIYIGVQY